MIVSLIIPTLNREEVLLKLLKLINLTNFYGIKNKDLEVIIIDQSDYDNLKIEDEIANSQYTIKYFRINQKGLPNARNLALLKAYGEICIFIDDDVEFNEYFIYNHIKEHNNIAIGAVAGKVLEEEDPFLISIKSVDGKTIPQMFGINRYGKYYPNRGGNTKEYVLGVSGGNFSIKKSLVTEVGLFDIRFRGNAQLEETDFAYRLRRKGYKILFSPEAQLFHLRLPSGGCRTHSLVEKRYWRIHNTILFSLKNFNKFNSIFIILILTSFSIYQKLFNKIKFLDFLFYLKAIPESIKCYLSESYKSFDSIIIYENCNTYTVNDK